MKVRGLFIRQRHIFDQTLSLYLPHRHRRQPHRRSAVRLYRQAGAPAGTGTATQADSSRRAGRRAAYLERSA